jgi:radical SAM superfamily enzyme YgiQ (UPF0313 family)
LKRIRAAGLDRLHVGMESGCDKVLELVSKGTTRAEQIKGGRLAKEAGFELSEYVMPGLGGAEWTDEHADDSASALVEIEPDFIRLRTTAVIPHTPLARLEEEGEFKSLTELQLVQEIRRFLTRLQGLTTRIESDHILNLLMEIHGNLPEDLDRLIDICDLFLYLPEKEQQRFVLARRLNLVTSLEERRMKGLRTELDRIFEKMDREGQSAEELFHELRKRMV